MYVISEAGEIFDRYDKRFCSGDAEGRTGDLAHYSPGDHPSVWEINGVRCGALICYEYRFPELYRQYAGEGVHPLLRRRPAGAASGHGEGAGRLLEGLSQGP